MLHRVRALMSLSIEPVDALRRRFTDTCSHFQLQGPFVVTWWGEVLSRYSEPQRRYHNVQHLTELFAHADHVAIDYERILFHYRKNLHLGGGGPTGAASSLSAASPVLAGDASPFFSAHSIALIIFFHDIIYDPKAHSGDNEERSALLFEDFCSKSEAASLQAVQPHVSSVIRATKNHMNFPRTKIMERAALPKITDVESGAVAAVVWGPCWEVDSALFLDMDIAILASPMSRYQEYADQIRQEYIHYPDDAFRNGRRQVLINFAKHAGINPDVIGEGRAQQQVEAEAEGAPFEDCTLFKTPLFHEWFIAQARRNIKWELAMLELPMFRSRTITIAGQQEVHEFQKRHHNNADMHCPFPLRILEADVEYMLGFAFEFCMCLRVGPEEKNNSILKEKVGDVGTMIAASFVTQTNRPGFVAEGGSAESFESQRRDHQYGGRYALLHAIVVHEAARNQGFGSKLLRELVMKLRATPSMDHPIERLFVCVPKPTDNSLGCREGSEDRGAPMSALRFYQKNGFTINREFVPPKEREALIELSLSI